MSNSLLSHSQLVRLVNQGVIDAPIENINGASIDITLDDTFLSELRPNERESLVEVSKKENLTFSKIKGKYFRLLPQSFVLVSSKEIFNLPSNIAAEYKLKSSLARVGLNHLLAGWCDPGWTNSKLTLELHNVCQYHTLVLAPGMKIGQMVFWECEPVPDNVLYSNVGQYNNQTHTTPSKGLR